MGKQQPSEKLNPSHPLSPPHSFSLLCLFTVDLSSGLCVLVKNIWFTSHWLLLVVSWTAHYSLQLKLFIILHFVLSESLVSRPSAEYLETVYRESTGNRLTTRSAAANCCLQLGLNAACFPSLVHCGLAASLHQPLHSNCPSCSSGESVNFPASIALSVLNSVWVVKCWCWASMTRWARPPSCFSWQHAKCLLT